MAEIEMHPAHPSAADPWDRRVGVVVGILGILLAVVTIASHRAHTASVIERTKANDQWTFFQSKKQRQHLAEVGASLATALAADPARVQGLIDQLGKDRDRYAHEAEEIQKDARAQEAQSDTQEHRALRFDLGEGFLELGLVLTSLYFLSKRRFFPLLGGAAAVVGVGFGIAGFLA